MGRKRVLHLGKYYPPAPGGMESHVQTLARGQVRSGWDVTVLCVNHAQEAGRDVTPLRYGATKTVVQGDQGVEVRRLGRSAHISRFDICPDFPSTLAEIRRRPFDAIHVHTPNPLMLIAAAVLLRENIPVVITHHSDVIRQKLLRYAVEPFQKLVYSRAAKIIASSSEYVGGSADLRRFASKTEVIPFGIDLQPFLEPSDSAMRFARQLAEDAGPVVWLAVGRCVYYKGLSTAIRALVATPGRLVIVGTGPEREMLQRLAAKLGVSERILWLSDLTIDQLVGAYHAATALWFPSSMRSEAFGLVQVEAMASGCPVINTRVEGSGVASVSPHEVSGLSIAVNDWRALADAASRLLAEPRLRRSLAEGARRRAIDEFCEADMVERALDLYERVRDRPLAPSRASTGAIASRGIDAVLVSQP